MTELSFRTLELGLRPTRVRSPVKCAAEDCSTTTVEGKPYCSEHVTLMPYASGIKKVLAFQAQEDAKARQKHSRPSLDSPTCQDLLTILEDGPRSVLKLARLLYIEEAQVLGYLRTLKYHKRVQTFPGTRGRIFVRLTGTEV